MVKKNSLILFIVFLFSISVTAQNSNIGKVTEIVDGRTVVITSNTGQKLTFMLQYIEVPEPEQPLSNVVKEHLAKLVLGKDARFFSNSTYSKGSIGTLFLGDIEINKQMVRDGAAWYNLPEYEFANVRSEYQGLEAQARTEKRGVWSIPGMKTAWAWREEEFNKIIAAKKAAQAANASKLPAVEKIWADVGTSSTAGVNEVGGYRTSYDRFKNLTEIKTAEMPLSVTPYNRENEFTFRVSHFFTGENLKEATNDYYTLTIRAKGTMLIVVALPELRLIIGSERILLDSPELDFEGDLFSKEPLPLFYKDKSNVYKINSKKFASITAGGNVQFRFGIYEGMIPAGYIGILKNLP